MQTQTITVELQLAGLQVLGVREDAWAIEVVACYEAEEVPCPHCARPTGQVHQWRQQRKQDADLWHKMVYLLLWKRRFRCRPCRKVFTEDDPICGRRRRTTARLRQRTALQAEEATVRTVARWHRVSEGLVQRSWLEAHSVVQAPATPHVYLGLDGFCVRRPGTMWTGLWDLQTRAPIAVVPGERTRDTQAMLELHASRDTVRAVSVDLSEAYRQAVQRALPHAAVVADKFHVIALASRALREVHGERRRPGNDAWLLQRAIERLRPAEQQRLAAMLRRDDALRVAWMLKEQLRALYRAPTAPRAELALERWSNEAAASGLPAFVRTAKTLRRWRAEVLNYWQHPITNAVVEGKHNRVKVLKRRAYGYRNQQTFLLRILNLIHTH
ncbi:MAG TPA: ISL3 family transposase [Dehalococcoidia bacterium]|nr:ISL3 family transposase [Dehalococcoidia bacterium]